MLDPQALDVRTLEPAEKHLRIFGAIEALAPGESLVLVNDHAPAMLAARLEALGPDRYQLVMLEEGPPIWRFRVERLKDGGPGSPPPPPAAPQGPA